MWNNIILFDKQNNIMVDIIRGPVTQVIDSDTFEMTVTHTGKNNMNKYNNSESVKIVGINVLEIGAEGEEESKKELKNKILGKEIWINVQTRDVYGRVLGKYEIV